MTSVGFASTRTGLISIQFEAPALVTIPSPEGTHDLGDGRLVVVGERGGGFAFGQTLSQVRQDVGHRHSFVTRFINLG